MAWCSLVLALGVCTGHAAMRKLLVADLAKKADTIILGTVVQRESAWNAQHTAIQTHVTLAVERVLAGKSEKEVTLQVFGGSVNGIGMRTSNDAEFWEGEQVIVFLNTRTVPSTVVGMQQGKFTVKDKMVIGAETSSPLEEFIATVRAAAR